MEEGCLGAPGREVIGTTPLQKEVENRFGVLPNFFLLASSDPTITEKLWGFAQFAYLDNPLPSLFKERLFVYLSRFCRVRYCIARHLGFLVGLGRPSGDANCNPQPIDAIMPLLQRSLPHGRELPALLEACVAPVSGVFPEPDSPDEVAAMACAAHVFLQTADATRAREALACRFDPRTLENLNLFLAFVRTAHYWAKLHPELSLEADITDLLAADNKLAELVLNDEAAEADSPNIRGADEITAMLELRKVQERLSAIVESSEDAIVSKDVNGVIESWNAGAERLFGYTADEVVGKSITIIIPSDRLAEEPEILSRLQRGERVEHFETIRQHKNGELLNISLTISPVKDIGGKVVGASKIARNITDRKRQEDALRAANEALLRSNADLEQFAYSASHDLQEPLRMVSAYSDMLQRRFGDKLGPEGDEFIGYIINASARMQQLLRDLRAFTQASQMTQDRPQNVNAEQALERSLSNLKTAVDDSGAVITHGSLPAVAIHEFQLEQLFQNIIGNAIRYRSHAPPVIHIDAQRADGKCTFSIRDNGIGIDPQFKEQIFGIFKRLHTTADYPGTGMGLAICQRIVERVGGRIWVESEPGRGSTFYFSVPSGKP